MFYGNGWTVASAAICGQIINARRPVVLPSVLPWVDECLRMIEGTTLFSALDVRDVDMHCPMAPVATMTFTTGRQEMKPMPHRMTVVDK